jgi:hypothetical protein
VKSTIDVLSALTFCPISPENLCTQFDSLFALIHRWWLIHQFSTLVLDVKSHTASLCDALTRVLCIKYFEAMHHKNLTFSQFLVPRKLANTQLIF